MANIAAKAAYSDFINGFKTRYSKIIIYNFYEVKHVIRVIAKLEKRNFMFGFYKKNNLLPPSVLLRNVILKRNFESTINKMEQQLFKRVIGETIKVLKREKKKKFYLLDCMFNRISEQDRIITIYHLNKYKLHLEFNNFKYIKKKTEFLSKKHKLIQDKDNNIVEALAFINRSNCIIPSHIESLLMRGPKHTIMQEKSQLVERVEKDTDFEYFVRSITDVQYESKRTDINILTNQQYIDLKKMKASLILEENKKRNGLHNKLIKEIKEFMLKEDIIAVEADKSKTIVFLDRVEYLKLMDEALTSNHFRKVEKDRHELNERKAQDVIRQLKRGNCISNAEYERLYPSGTPTCTIKAKIKLHKEPPRMRPIVDASKSYFKNLSRWILGKINKYNKHESALKNPADLINRLKGFKMEPGYIMCSVDAVEMFSNINLDLVIAYILKCFEDDEEKNIEITPVLLKKNLYLCVTDITAFFNGSIYLQDRGVGMGVVLASFFADIYMSILEKQFLGIDNLGLLHYSIYIDDAFLIFSGEEKIEPFLAHLNMISDTLKFTVEKEKNKVINFLDLTIKNTEMNIEFSVFRKITSNSIKLNYNSDYPRHILINNLNQDLRRAFEISTNEAALMEELNKIRSIYVKNDYPLNVINECIMKCNSQHISAFGSGTIKKHKLADCKKNKNGKTERFHPILLSSGHLDFFKNGLSTLKDGNNWNNLKGCHIIEKAPPNLMSAIKNVNKKQLEHSQADNIVYQLVCSCQSGYVGQTGRNLILRYNEHLKNKNSPISIHLAENPGHVMSLENARILHREECELRRLVIEGCYIKQLHPKCNRECQIGYNLRY